MTGKQIQQKGKKTVFRIVYGRTIVVVLALLLQVVLLVLSFIRLTEYSTYILIGLTVLSWVLAIYILNRSKDTPEFKLAWIIPVIIIPVFGSLFYIFIRLQLGTKLLYKRHKYLLEETKPLLKQESSVEQELKKENKQVWSLANYMNHYGGYPIYENTSVKYFPLGDDKFEEMKIQLEKAEKFIFMEYFIVEEGKMWNAILEILERKAKQGVDVRFMYDGMCCLVLVPYSYPKKLQEKGIKCKMFQPIRPALSTEQNNRDHRKILVIDGHTAFTGGVNLADEYINQKEVYGHWKDTAVMIKGDAVQSFTIMFLQMWNITEKEDCDYSLFLNRTAEPEKQDNYGFVMPYGDSPLDNEYVGENVYLDILNTAEDYVHIMTPYLIIDNEIITALKYSAKRGIETTIIMPHIPDKMYAYLLARTFYQELIEAGVNIYEYTPGFVHAKCFISDDKKATVGTVNLDYRSFFLHFECGVFMYGNDEIANIEKDYQETLKKCRKITIEDCKHYPIVKKVAGRVLRLIAPLM